MKRISKILIITSLIFTIIGSTFAYLTWQATTSERTEVTFTVTSDFSCAADGGGDITSGDVTLFPCSCTNSTYAIKREIKVTPTINTPIPVYMDLWLDINELGSGLSNSDNFRYALTTSADSCANPISSGTFKGKTSGDKVTLLNKMSYPETMTDTYYLWIWLDKEETSSDTMNQVVNLSLNGSCTDQIEISPDVPDGLIPVTIANDGTVTTISKTDDNWYNYNQKKWANAVLVSETNRSRYQDNTNVTIPESDILAYYVWIPRYKYKIWTTGTSSAGNEQEIDIIFETKDTTRSMGSQVGEYLTHPAFTFGSNELNGIWVGKFETTGTADNPTIKPNVSSLREQDVSEYFKNSLKFSGGILNNGATSFSGNNMYGLGSNVNSHMAKNTEWSAAAYLSHSKYGINTEVRKNNNSSFITGCGGSVDNPSSSSACEIAYGNAIEYPQSTTGNITGIFDMSGGSYENIMGVFANSDGVVYSGVNSTLNSGFNGLLYDSGNNTLKSDGIDFPEEKYYNVYKATSGTTIDPLTACNSGYCYGHGISEVPNWYNDVSKIVVATNPWIHRGGGYGTGVYAGVFDLDRASGYDDVSALSFRSILAIP